MPARTTFPLAYHITWGTYGTRLHGDDRGTVCRDFNQYGDPIVGEAQDWQQMETKLLRFRPRILTTEQRLQIENNFVSICTRGKWGPIAVAAAGDHVHAMLKADAEGTEIRKWLKRWMGESLSKTWPLEAGETWWAECGSVKWIWTPDYDQRVIGYILRQRTPRTK